MEQFDTKKSSNLHWARFCPQTNRLEIDFKNAAGEKVSTYVYEGFTPEDWAKFIAAPSQGQHFAYHIRPNFKGVKLPLREPV